jgi:Ca-activated chloride channel family protein
LTKVEIDEKLLESIASKTGGLYFRATDNKKLKEIYQEINKLEKTDVEEFKYSNAQEMYRLFVLFSIILILLEWVLRTTLFKSFI